MCDMCDEVDRLIAEVNAGTRTFDRDVLRATLTQGRHVIGEALDDIESDKPLHALLSDCADTMSGLAVAWFVNARTVAHAAHVERDRLVKLATEAEQEKADRKYLIDHIINQHNVDGDLDPAKLLLAEFSELQQIHNSVHRDRHHQVTAGHIKTGRDV